MLFNVIIFPNRPSCVLSIEGKAMVKHEAVLCVKTNRSSPPNGCFIYSAGRYIYYTNVLTSL